MANLIKIETIGDLSYVYTPYNADFIEQIKSGIGGSYWDARRRAWCVPTENLPEVRIILQRHYGEDDLPSTEPTYTVKLTFRDIAGKFHGPVIACGKIISSAKYRDSGATCQEGVSFLEGHPQSGGSAKNWTSLVPAGSVILVRGVTKKNLSKKLPQGCTMEILDQPPTYTALVEERQRLQERLAEVDKLLENYQTQKEDHHDS